MGVTAMVGATLLGGFLTARQQQQQYKAQARQAEQNAQIAYNNAEKLQKQGEIEAQNNAINEENKRRRLLQQQSQNRAAVGAAGITASGSALAAMADDAYNQEMELAVNRYNNRQKVDSYFQSSTDNVNQGDIYMQNARDYRKAGKRAMMNTMLTTALSLAGNLYSGKSVGAQKAGAVVTQDAGGNYTVSDNVNYKGNYFISGNDYMLGVKPAFNNQPKNSWQKTNFF